MKARCILDIGVSKLVKGAVYDVEELPYGYFAIPSLGIGAVSKQRFQVIQKNDPNECCDTLPSIEAAKPEPNDVDFFRPKADNWTCGKCGGCKPCNYHD